MSESNREGKRAVVTGGGAGIGAAIAESLVGMGMAVTLMGRNRERLERARERIGAAACVTVDVADEASVAAAFAETGRVDVLVNNAGIASSAPFQRIDTAEWRRLLSVNLDGVFFCCRAVLDGMRERGWGRIVNVASVAGLRGYPYVAAYCASKHGVIGLTRSLAIECALKGITVNAVCPGYADTEMTQATLKNIEAKTGRSYDEALAELVKMSPQRRLVTPGEVADAVAWLCADASSAVTGQSIAVAGGEVM